MVFWHILCLCKLCAWLKGTDLMFMETEFEDLQMWNIPQAGAWLSSASGEIRPCWCKLRTEGRWCRRWNNCQWLPGCKSCNFVYKGPRMQLSLEVGCELCTARRCSWYPRHSTLTARVWGNLIGFPCRVWVLLRFSLIFLFKSQDVLSSCSPELAPPHGTPFSLSLP